MKNPVTNTPVLTVMVSDFESASPADRRKASTCFADGEEHICTASANKTAMDELVEQFSTGFNDAAVDVADFAYRNLVEKVNYPDKESYMEAAFKDDNIPNYHYPYILGYKCAKSLLIPLMYGHAPSFMSTYYDERGYIEITDTWPVPRQLLESLGLPPEENLINFFSSGLVVGALRYDIISSVKPTDTDNIQDTCVGFQPSYTIPVCWARKSHLFFYQRLGMSAVEEAVYDHYLKSGRLNAAIKEELTSSGHGLSYAAGYISGIFYHLETHFVPDEEYLSNTYSEVCEAAWMYFKKYADDYADYDAFTSAFSSSSNYVGGFLTKHGSKKKVANCVNADELFTVAEDLFGIHLMKYLKKDFISDGFHEV